MALSQLDMMASTLGDAIKLWDPKSRVISISLNPQSATLGAGHSGDAAYWLNPYSGVWMTSSYYLANLPDWVKDFNKKKFADTYVEQSWETLLPLGSYQGQQLSAIDTTKQNEVNDKRKSPMETDHPSANEAKDPLHKEFPSHHRTTQHKLECVNNRYRAPP